MDETMEDLFPGFDTADVERAGARIDLLRGGSDAVGAAARLATPWARP
jgi:hypothetical protein